MYTNITKTFVDKFMSSYSWSKFVYLPIADRSLFKLSLAYHVIKGPILSPILNNVSLERVQCTKFLRIIIDDGLKWTNHISYIKK